VGCNFVDDGRKRSIQSSTFVLVVLTRNYFAFYACSGWFIEAFCTWKGLAASVFVGTEESPMHVFAFSYVLANGQRRDAFHKAHSLI
jgi:hypothetical protein